MKHSLFNFIKLFVLVTVTVAGFQYVQAFNGPSTVSVPLNTAADSQVKQGGITAKYFGALAQRPGFDSAMMPPATTFDGIAFARSMIKTYDALFTKQLHFTGSDYQLKIGSNQNVSATDMPDPATELFSRSAYPAPLTIDLSGRGNNNPTGKNALEIISGDAVCKDYTTVRVNTSAVEFKNRSSNTPIDIVAKQVRLTGGQPAANRVLLSTNANGDAVWATVEVSGGRIVYKYKGRTPVNGDSPIVTSQICQP